MSYGETAFLVLVLVAFSTFIGVVGFVSIWSRRPTEQIAAKTPAAADTAHAPRGRPGVMADAADRQTSKAA